MDKAIGGVHSRTRGKREGLSGPHCARGRKWKLISVHSSLFISPLLLSDCPWQDPLYTLLLPPHISFPFPSLAFPSANVVINRIEYWPVGPDLQTTPCLHEPMTSGTLWNACGAKVSSYEILCSSISVVGSTPNTCYTPRRGYCLRITFGGPQVARTLYSHLVFRADRLPFFSIVCFCYF